MRLKITEAAAGLLPALAGLLLGAALAIAASSVLAGAQKPASAKVAVEGLQQAVDGAMAGLSGAAVVMDVESGRLIAAHRIEVAARRLAPPGSTLKPFTLRALLEARAIQPDTRLVCPQRLTLAGHHMDCSHPRTPAALDAASALAHSCNNYFAHFAARIEDSALDRAYAHAGLDSATGLASDEAVGQMQHSTTPERHRLKALGAADVLVTPIGLLNAYRRLALRRRQASDAATDPVFAGLEASTAWGMARAARVDGLSVAGKTGTAGAAKGPWTHAWFAGYAPAEKPEVAVVVFLERGTGATAAAPVAQEIFAAYQQARRQP